MKTKLLAVFALAAVMLLLSAGANASTIPVLFIYDTGTGNMATVLDNDNDGIVNFTGTVGDFELTVDTGQASPPLGVGQSDLSFVATNSFGSTTSSLWIYLSILNNPNPTGGVSYLASIGGTANPPASVDWWLYTRSNNTACDSTNALSCALDAFTSNAIALGAGLGGGAFSATAGGSLLPGGNPYSLVQIVGVNNLAVGETATGDYHLAVPEPASLTLLGSGFLGLLGFFRRRK